MKTKILFFHFDLGGGGAERVLVNLVNHLDKKKYDLTLQVIFGQGVNRKYLSDDITFKCLFNRPAFRGMKQLFKLLPPKWIHKLLIREKYDIEIAFLELIPTRIIGGCTDKNTRLYTWIHNTTFDIGSFSSAFRGMKEFYNIYAQFDKIAFVSEGAKKSFYKTYDVKTPGTIVHNVIDTEEIVRKSLAPIDIKLNHNVLNLCSVGRLCGQKGFDRLFRCLKNIVTESDREWHLYLIGAGPEKQALTNQASNLGLLDKITFLGFQTNPFKYVSKMDVFVCSSISEGYSTAVTESLIVGTPVLTTDCSGMDELIGNTNAGIIVENSEYALTNGLRRIFNDANLIDRMRNAAKLRGQIFSTEVYIKEFENFIEP